MRLISFLCAALAALAFSGSAVAVPPGMEVTFPGGPAPVIFSGKVHADKGLKCPDCHTDTFKMQKGAQKITFADHSNGKFCASCHNGEKAFKTMENCGKCHGNKPAAAAP